MHAAIRRIKLKPGQAGAVAGLIESEYVPMVADLPGFLSYTLVDLGEDQVSSVGLFTDAEAANRANATAQAWSSERLSPYVASPLEAHAGAVLVDKRAG